MSFCAQCGIQAAKRGYVYCSNQCQADHEYDSYIKKWLNGEVSGGRGVHARNISGHVKRYMFNQNKIACSLCGWHEINVVTGTVPLEIDHIDGDAENNCVGNLRLLCPNCHSLTPGFRNLNRGKGRKWRRDKYLRHTDATLAQR